MTPEELAKPNTEHAHQRAYFCWLNQQSFEPIKKAFAIPNGGERNKAVASKLKAEGVKRGVPDVFVPVPVWNDGIIHRCGLWLEFKAPGDKGKAKGRLKKEQEEWRDFLILQNYSHFVVYDYLQAIEATIQYLSLKT